MIQQLAPVLVLIVVVALFAVVSLSLTFIAGPKRNTSHDRELPYECGIPGNENETTRFPVKFYLTAILFILFDIEVIFLYPWAIIYTDFLKMGPFIFVEMITFMIILTFGLFYVWKGHALDWD